MIAKFEETYRQLQEDANKRKNNASVKKTHVPTRTSSTNLYYDNDDNISYGEINVSSLVSLEGSTVELIKIGESSLPVLKGNQIIRYIKFNALFIGDADFTTGYAKGMLKYGNEELIEIDVKGGENDEKGLLFEKDGQPPLAWFQK